MTIQKKPKIAILSIKNSYNYGGVLSSLKVVHQFCQNYFEPKVFFLGFDHEIATSLRSLKFTSSVKPLSYFGMNCIEVGARWAFWEPGHYKYTIQCWKELLADYEYFFVVSGTNVAAHPLALLNKKFTMWVGTPYAEDRAERVKQLTGLRFMLDLLAQKRMLSIEKKILKKSSFTWAISTYAQQHFATMLGGSRKNLALCGFPIDCSQVIYFPKGNSKIILAVGRFSDPRKNIDMLIRVFSRLHATMPDATLFVAGKRPIQEKMLEYSTLPCFSRITFTGQVTGDDLKTLYSRANLLLITSHQEGLGIVGLEALLHGVPVVATDCGGTRDYVINDVTGYLVQPNDDDAMVTRARMILQNPLLYQQLSRAGRQFVEEHYSINKIYALFKQGLSATYPELYDWFYRCDREKVLQARKHATRIFHDIA